LYGASIDASAAELPIVNEMNRWEFNENHNCALNIEQLRRKRRSRASHFLLVINQPMKNRARHGTGCVVFFIDCSIH